MVSLTAGVTLMLRLITWDTITSTKVSSNGTQDERGAISWKYDGLKTFKDLTMM